MGQSDGRRTRALELLDRPDGAASCAARCSGVPLGGIDRQLLLVACRDDRGRVGIDCRRGHGHERRRGSERRPRTGARSATRHGNADAGRLRCPAPDAPHRGLFGRAGRSSRAPAPATPQTMACGWPPSRLGSPTPSYPASRRLVVSTTAVAADVLSGHPDVTAACLRCRAEPQRPDASRQAQDHRACPLHQHFSAPPRGAPTTPSEGAVQTRPRLGEEFEHDHPDEPAPAVRA